MWQNADDALARQLGETMPASQALTDYALLGEGTRSLRKLQQHYLTQRAAGATVPTVRIETLEDWSRKYRWQDRVGVVDQEARLKRLQDAQAEISAMHGRHIQMAQAFQSQVLLWLKDPSHGIRKAADAAAFLKLGISIERQARGVPAVLIELATLSDQELQQRYERMISSMRAEAQLTTPMDDDDLDDDAL